LLAQACYSVAVTLTSEQKEAYNAWRSSRRRLWKEEIDRRKMETGCQWPGCRNVIEIPEQLDFAHVSQDDKAFNIGDFMNRSPHVEENWARLEAEIAKCQILCLLHHRVETIAQNHMSYRRGNKPAA
jgi:hypothetical protein